MGFVFGPLSPLVAVSAFVWGAHFLGWGDAGKALRASLLPAGVLLVVPTLLWIMLARGRVVPPDVGWLGTVVGSGLKPCSGGLAPC